MNLEEFAFFTTAAAAAAASEKKGVERSTSGIMMQTMRTSGKQWAVRKRPKKAFDARRKENLYMLETLRTVGFFFFCPSALASLRAKKAKSFNLSGNIYEEKNQGAVRLVYL